MKNKTNDHHEEIPLPKAVRKSKNSIRLEVYKSMQLFRSLILYGFLRSRKLNIR